MPPKFYKKSIKSNEIKSTNLSYAKYLIIVESPSKCAKIEHFLGSDYSCIASKGHLRTINGLKSIDTKKTFAPTFSIIEEKREHIKNMEKIIKKFSNENILLATDDDREGEAIAWHICDIFNLPLSTPRIIFHEITKDAIIKSIKEPTVINMSLVFAQQARQVLDIIVGYKISPYLWTHLYNNKDNSLSAGRCQTPALRLIYENEKEKDDNLNKKYKITSNMTERKYTFNLTKNIESEENLLIFLEKSKDFKHILSIGSQTTINKSPPKPFSTSRLLQTASNQLHMSPKETMSLCQQLYQNGYITYMRTESSQYSRDFIEKMKLYIQNTYKNDKYIGDISKIINTNSENPHEAIRATQIELKNIPNCENNRLSTLYKLIWKNTMESCMSIAIIQNRNVFISAPLEHEYKLTLETPIFLGWKIIQFKCDITEEQNKISAELLYFQNLCSQKKPIPYNEINCELTVSSNHSYYTEASLVSKLESLEIGRPSTYSNIIETIKERGYVVKADTPGYKINCNNYTLQNNEISKKTEEKTFCCEKNKLLIQPVGILALEFLTKYFDKIFSYEYTKNMESKLDLISNKEILDWSSICKECYNELKELAKSTKNISKNSYTISDGYEFIFEKYGPVIKHTLEDGTIEYLPGNKELDINIENLKNNVYKLDDLLDPGSQCLGKYKEHDLVLKNGRYGYYVEWDTNRESIKEINIPIEKINIEDITEFLNNKTTPENKAVLRELNKSMSVRKGKYGAYVFYQTKEMKKPKFLNIKKCPHGFLNCEAETLIEWLCNEYKIPTS